MIRNTFLAVGFAIVIIAINLHSDVVHIPLFFVFISALILGYLQPKKGWISVIQLAVSIFAGFYLSKVLGFAPLKFSVFQFITYISPLPCLFGGFMGSYFNKAINQNDDRRSPKNRGWMD
jgi:ABC-type xylose transport system permease subunit